MRLLWRFWPQLLLLGAIGYVLRDLLLVVAVRAGLQNALAGMVILSLVVLTKLVVIVLMFAVLRPALPGVASLQQPARSAQASGDDSLPISSSLLTLTAAAILPFFVYYAAWGFLGNVVREYSRLALANLPFGESAHFLDVMQSRWLIGSIVACWIIRWFAKRMSKTAKSPYWHFLVVAADASWMFIGLYGLSIYKDQLIESIGSGTFSITWSPLGIAAWAADGFTPVEFTPPDFLDQAQALGLYALLPIVWLVMAAIIVGYDVKAGSQADPAAPAPAWRKSLESFISYFIKDYRERYQPAWKCVRLALGAGVASMLTLVIAYQLIGWCGAWLWVIITRAIGALDLATWQVLSGPIAVFIGSPADLDGGILLDAGRICLLAGVLEYAVSSGMKRDAQNKYAIMPGASS